MFQLVARPLSVYVCRLFSEGGNYIPEETELYGKKMVSCLLSHCTVTDTVKTVGGVVVSFPVCAVWE